MCSIFQTESLSLAGYHFLSKMEVDYNHNYRAKSDNKNVVESMLKPENEGADDVHTICKKIG